MKSQLDILFRMVLIKSGAFFWLTNVIYTSFPRRNDKVQYLKIYLILIGKFIDVLLITTVSWLVTELIFNIESSKLNCISDTRLMIFVKEPRF